MYSLKPLLGYIIAGHELGYPSRALDIYIPACIDLWKQYLSGSDRSAKVLNDALLLTFAFFKAKQWTKLGNILDFKMVTPEANIHLFLNGETGTNAFSTIWEPILYSLFVPLSDEQRQKLEKLAIAESTYKLAHRKGEQLYDQIIVPLVRQVIEETKVKEQPDFIQLPEFKETESMCTIIKDKVLDAKTEGSWLLAQQLIAVGKVLTSNDCAAWKHIEKNYTIAIDLNACMKTALQSITEFKFDTVQLIEYLIVAHAFPSNSQRRLLASSTSKTARDVLKDRVKQVLTIDLTKDEREKYYKVRYTQIRAHHAGYPLIWSTENARWLCEDVAKLDNSDQFVQEFIQRFDIQLRHDYLYYKHICTTWEEYLDQVKFSLTNVWDNSETRASFTSSTVGFSCTCLPRLRCGHVLCEQFLKFDPTVETTHWIDMGSDLPCQSSYRFWIPSMHMMMQTVLQSNRTNCDGFVSAMLVYASKYIDPQLVKDVETYYTWYWNHTNVLFNDWYQYRKHNSGNNNAVKKNHSFYFK